MGNISDAVRAVVSACPNIKVRYNEPMKNHTSFRIGGEVAAMFIPSSAREAEEILYILRNENIHPLVMGNGTNLLVEDGYLDMAVVKMQGGLMGMKLRGDSEIESESGVLLSRLAVFAQENGLTGLEFAHGIPGTLGGAVFMNAGAYGGEIKDVVITTKALGKDGVFTTQGGEHRFSYRHSRFSEEGSIVLSSVLKLMPGDPDKIKARMDELSEKRRSSQPLSLPSAGSTFKRPEGGYAAAMIEKAGLKGYTVGGAQVSEKHSGFIVNLGGATFEDVMAVIGHVQEKVFADSGTTLEPEVRIIRRPD